MLLVIVIVIVDVDFDLVMSACGCLCCKLPAMLLNCQQIEYIEYLYISMYVEYIAHIFCPA